MYQFPQQFVIVDWLLDYQEIHVLFAANIAEPGISVLEVELANKLLVKLGMIQKLHHPFLRHFRLVGSAFLLHHVLADQWVVVIILLVFSTKENMFVEHTENMMMDIFLEFHAVAWGNNPKNCNIK